MWDLPRPGLEPVSPALAGRFSTTAPPGKPQCIFFEGHNSPSNTEAREDGKPGSRPGEGELSVRAWVLRPAEKFEREIESRDICSCIGSNRNRCSKVRFSVRMVWLKL